MPGMTRTSCPVSIEGWRALHPEDAKARRPVPVKAILWDRKAGRRNGKGRQSFTPGWVFEIL